jgi:hypothetical protein
MRNGWGKIQDGDSDLGGPTASILGTEVWATNKEETRIFGARALIVFLSKVLVPFNCLQEHRQVFCYLASV